jgi:Acetyltransferase (GNAT) domain
MNDLIVSRHDGPGAIADISSDIDGVNARAQLPSPFASSYFLASLVRHSEYDAVGVRPMVLLVRAGHSADVIGFGAFVWRDEQFVSFGLRSILKAPRVDLLTSSDADRPSIVACAGHEDNVAEAILRYLVAHVPGWQLVEFRSQEPGSPLHRAAHRLGSPRLRTRDISLVPYTEVALRNAANMQTFVNVGQYFSALSKRMRSNVSRQTRNLYWSGHVELLHATTGPGCEAFFDAYLDLERRSWKHGTDAAVTRHAERVAFVRELVSGRAGLEPSLVGVVVDGVLIAALYNGHYEDRTWCQEMIYDESYAHIGPGQPLLLMAIGEAIDRKDRSVNFFQLHGYFKKRWLAEEIDVVNVQLLKRPGLFDAKGIVGDRLRDLQKRRASSNRAAGEGEGPSEETGAPNAEPSNPSEHSSKSEAGFNPLRRTAASNIDTAATRDAATIVESKALLANCIERAGAAVTLTDPSMASRWLPFSIASIGK